MSITLCIAGGLCAAALLELIHAYLARVERDEDGND